MDSDAFVAVMVLMAGALGLGVVLGLCLAPAVRLDRWRVQEWRRLNLKRKHDEASTTTDHG